MFDENTGEKHIADVKTSNDIIIEFQHSAISQEEINSREQFYTQKGRQLIWIIDGNLSKKDYTRFEKGIKEYNFLDFPKKWLNFTVPVFVDFGIDNMSLIQNDNLRKNLWILLPISFQKKNLSQ